MSSIKIISENIKYRIKYTVRLSKSIITNIYTILKKYNSYIPLELENKLNEDKEFYDLSVNEFATLFEKLIDHARSCLVTSNDVTLDTKTNEQYLNTVSKFENALSSVKDANSISDALIYSYLDSEIDIEPIINYAIEINNYKFLCYKARDLVNAKDNLLENLKYLSSSDEINKINVEYEQALNDLDIDKMEKILNYINMVITNHWHEFITKPEDIEDAIKNNKPIYFLGHSTNSTEFKTPFHSRFVSNSLLTNDLTDTYHGGYGFIIAPVNIVGAKSKDMHVDNDAQDVENIAFYSSIPLIDTPEKIIKECLDLKKENKKHKIDCKVYSEIVTDGFNPIGIFCITDGSKTLNSNYTNALKLHKSFSNLPFVEIDKTLLTNDNLENCSHLIDVIMDKLDNHDYYISTHRDLRFRLFWEKFMALKKQGDYTEEDILKIYKENEEYITMTNFKDLDKKGYNDKTLKYILLKNFYTNIEYIFKREIYNPKIYEFLYNSLKDLPTDFLNNIIPNLGDFIKLYSVIKVDSEMVFAINNLDTINFKNINKVLLNKIAAKQMNMQTSLQQMLETEKSLEQKLAETQNLANSYQTAKKIKESQYQYKLADEEIKKITEKTNEEENNKRQYQDKNNILKSDLNEKEQKLAKYKKIFFLYLFKIKKIKKEIEKLKEEINNNEITIKELEINIGFLYQELAINYKYFQEQIGCDFNKYPQVLTESLDLLETTNPNDLDITNIKSNLEYFQKQIEYYKMRITELESVMGKDNIKR